MLTLAECRDLAQGLLAQISVSCDVDLVLTEYVVTYNNSAAFHYQSAEYLQTGELSAALAGNGALVVHRLTGCVDTAGSALPLEQYLKDFDTLNKR